MVVTKHCPGCDKDFTVLKHLAVHECCSVRCGRKMLSIRHGGSERTCHECGGTFWASKFRAKCSKCRPMSKRDGSDICTCGKSKPVTAEVCNICILRARSAAQIAELSTNWKGGRSLTSEGYVMVYMPDHPRAKVNRKPYVQEHVLVMEQTLSRYLLPGENVHHKNGVRNDNRPENLELWAVAQPAGQRVNDRLSHAWETVFTYGTFSAESEEPETYWKSSLPVESFYP